MRIHRRLTMLLALPVSSWLMLERRRKVSPGSRRYEMIALQLGDGDVLTGGTEAEDSREQSAVSPDNAESTSTGDSTTTTGLFSLPAELRLWIYAYCIAEKPCQLAESCIDGFNRHAFSPLTQVNRQLRSEVLPLYPQWNQLDICRCMLHGDRIDLFLRGPGAIVVPLVCKVEIGGINSELTIQLWDTEMKHQSGIVDVCLRPGLHGITDCDGYLHQEFVEPVNDFQLKVEGVVKAGAVEKDNGSLSDHCPSLEGGCHHVWVLGQGPGPEVLQSASNGGDMRVELGDFGPIRLPPPTRQGLARRAAGLAVQP